MTEYEAIKLISEGKTGRTSYFAMVVDALNKAHSLLKDLSNYDTDPATIKLARTEAKNIKKILDVILKKANVTSG